MEPNVSNLIKYAYDQKPIEFNNELSALFKNNLATAIDAKKVEIAKNLFNNKEEDNG